MNWNAHLARADEFEKRFLEKMPKTEDLTLLVLKGHLLIEELINSIIDALLPTPAALKSARLDCYQRTRLLMVMIPDYGFHDILETFEKLNTLRNKFGHMLEPPQIEARIAAFIDMVESRMEENLNASMAPPTDRLSRVICFLCGQLQMMSLFYIGVSQLKSLNADYPESTATTSDGQVGK